MAGFAACCRPVIVGVERRFDCLGPEDLTYGKVSLTGSFDRTTEIHCYAPNFRFRSDEALGGNHEVNTPSVFWLSGHLFSLNQLSLKI